MTLRLRRKRQTTARATSTSTRTAASLLALGLLLAAGPARAGTPEPAWVSSPPGAVPAAAAHPTEMMYFNRGADPNVTGAAGPAPARSGPSLTDVLDNPQPPAPQPTEPVSRPLPLPNRLGLDPRAQPELLPRPLSPDEASEYYVPLDVPGSERLFNQLDSEAALRERLRQEARNRSSTDRIQFPEEPIISKDTYVPRHYPPGVERAEPYYVCHRRLYFQDLNAERYGWDLGIVQPAVSLGLFWFDLAFLPYHYFTHPCQQTECSAGYCLPGDPVPYLIYPPEISLTGFVAEGATIAALFGLFP